ncbi:hypothetical protein C349_05010 [Cryptococcus neoformans var. grubii Br795]|nr:hypothetical protein C349_05010 [Cryptococcus neoformans var. grubii Br795]
MSDKVNDRALSAPVVIHYHRGGMLIGSKGDIYPSFMPVYLQSRKILLILLNYRLLFPSSADDIIEDVRSLFIYIASVETELSFILFQRPLPGYFGSIVPRPIGWLDLFGMGGDWLLDFWINGVDVERTMPLDITLHDMAKADELMKTGGGAVVSEVESVLVDGKVTGELGRFNLWIAWQKRASSLAMSYLSLESQPDSLKYRISLG